MQRRQYLTLRSGILLMVALLLPLLVAEAQLDVSNKSTNMSPSSPPTIDVPANATLDYTGHAWECKRGYQRSGDACAAVNMPANATLDYTGHTWECKHGYQRSGDACAVVNMPVNATLDYDGHAWECKHGYQRSGNACIVVNMPVNATLDYTGHAWECKHGYQRSGNACAVVNMPVNATLDYDGHAWECDRDYRRVGDVCIKITALPKTAMYDASAVQESSVNQRQQSDAKKEIRQVQEQLKEAGFDPGPTDGILGPQTIKALHRYLATR
jgi:hypothetical protein